jgi:hypothetical protein
LSKLAGKAKAEAKSDALQNNEVFMIAQDVKKPNKLKESLRVGLRVMCVYLAMGVYKIHDGK